MMLWLLYYDKNFNEISSPFVLGKKESLIQLAEESGVSNVKVTTHSGTAKFPSVRSLVEADLRGWLPVMGVNMDEEKIIQILAEAEQALNAYVNEQGQAVFPVSAHIIIGSKLN
jgi:hypothetical protein